MSEAHGSGNETMARPTVFSPELAVNLIASARRGEFLTTNAALHGIAESTLHEWLSRGRRGDEPYAQFAVDMARADAEWESETLAAVDRISEEAGDWKAKAKRLEWKHPGRYVERQHVVIERTREEYAQQIWETMRAALSPEEFATVARKLGGRDAVPVPALDASVIATTPVDKR